MKLISNQSDQNQIQYWEESATNDTLDIIIGIK